MSAWAVRQRLARLPVRRAPFLAAFVAALVAAPAPAAGSRFPLAETPELVPGAVSGGRDLLVGDVDGDGLSDIVTGAVTVVPGTVDGWAAPQHASGGSGSARIAVGDLTGDGRDDVVLVRQSGELFVFRGSATGLPATASAEDTYALTSAAPDPPPYGGSPLPPGAVDLADIDGDGDRDVVAAFPLTPPFVLVNDGTGHLTSLGTVADIPVVWDLRLVRLGGDGDPDLVVIGSGTENVRVAAGAEGAQFAASGAAGSTDGTRLATGDLDGDGTLDLVTARTSVADQFAAEPAVRVARGVAGSPEVGPFMPLPATTPARDRWVSESVAVGDLDRDGRADVAGSLWDQSGSWVADYYLRGPADDVQAATLPVFAIGYAPSLLWDHLAIADVDGDDRPDLITDRHTATPVSGLQVRYGLGPLLAPEPDSVDVGTATVGAASSLATLTFRNVGPGAAAPTVLTDGDREDFTVQSGTCDGRTLAVDAACTLSVAFHPRQAAVRTLSVALVDPHADEVSWMTVTDRGVAPSADTAPSPAPSPAPQSGTPTGATRPAGRIRRRSGVRLIRTGGAVILDTGLAATCSSGPGTCRVRLLATTRSAGGRRHAILVSRIVTLGAAQTLRVRGRPGRHGAARLRSARRLATDVHVELQRTGAATVVVDRTARLTWPGGRR